ncbi:SGNH/GDSL hydrolase family protein [Rhodococcus sp. HNM0569]|uniref:SGNH/GDSL hydrolase family protein n=1 Tax=Rhodococcus sp. HNM0569 TaxID=2716340 RepID=UPI00146EB981|nr:SGNH/GDSL hydrolase family protein [Rhodococcus sp. HNM0569]NLU82546.1 SGNH/GDSL hydrolase family protein [Rhodococcus sp. HNM0569]
MRRAGSVIGILTALALGVAGTASAMPAPAPVGAQYVSLGDSYVATGSFASGEMHGGCAQASDSVGRLVAARLPGVSFGDWACGGADTADLTEDTPMGAQVAGLSANTRYVSLSIGGNNDDLFGDLVQNCLVALACTPEFQQATDAKLDRLGPARDTAYDAVRAHAPHAKVVVVGYLRVLPDDAAGCFAEALTTQPGVDFANRVQRRLNDEIAAAVDRAGFTMVNRQQDDTHSMCAPDGARHVSLTGIGPGDDGTPVHPTLLGRHYTADLVADAFLGV